MISSSSETSTITLTPSSAGLILRLREKSREEVISDTLQSLRRGGVISGEALEALAQCEGELSELLRSDGSYEKIAQRLAVLFADLTSSDASFESHRNMMEDSLRAFLPNLPKGISSADFLQTIELTRKQEKKLEMEFKTTKAAMESIDPAKSKEKKLARLKRLEEMSRKMSAVEDKEIKAAEEHIDVQDEEMERLDKVCESLNKEIEDLHLQRDILIARIEQRNRMFARINEALDKSLGTFLEKGEGG